MNAPEPVERRIAGLLADLRAGAPAALAKAITLVENDGPWTAAILQAIAADVGGAQVIGVTGPPGAGKSTLINAFIHELRRRGKSVAVAAVDPSSPLSGGAILGDRIRMTEHLGDAGVFVRSLSSRGHLGGLSAATARVVDVMEASGRDVVIVETVGAGQSEVEVADIADTKIVIGAPGQGDAIQAIKSGILEIADVLVVNKGDLPLAEQTASELRSMLALRVASDWAVPVLITEATTPRGIEELADAVDRHRLDHVADAVGRRRDPLGRARRLIAEAVAREIRTRLRQGDDARLTALCDQVRRGEISVDAAARRWLDGDSSSPDT
jgi:LAO/AO transport system kinase